MSHDSEPGLHQKVPQSAPEVPPEAYTEETFRHFLTIERKRAERAGRTVLLLLVHLHAADSGSAPAAVASRLFGALTACLREIDFIGWYRAGRVAGAVLVQGPEAPTPDRVRSIETRIRAALRERLSSTIGDRIDVCVLPVRSTTES